MIDVRRIGHATLTTPDLDAQVDYYTGIVGLEPDRARQELSVLRDQTGP